MDTKDKIIGFVTLGLGLLFLLMSFLLRLVPEDGTLMFLTLFPVAAVMLCFSIYFLTNPSRKRKYRLYLIENGFHVPCLIDSVDIDRTITVNGRHGCYIRCHGSDPCTGENRSFKSPTIMHDPTPAITRNEVDVYVDRNNPKKYFVNMESCMQ